MLPSQTSSSLSHYYTVGPQRFVGLQDDSKRVGDLREGGGRTPPAIFEGCAGLIAFRAIDENVAVVETHCRMNFNAGAGLLREQFSRGRQCGQFLAREKPDSYPGCHVAQESRYKFGVKIRIHEEHVLPCNFDDLPHLIE